MTVIKASAVERMQRKFYTFLIFPGANGKLHKIQVPFYVMHLIVGLSVAGLVALGALANSYARMLLKVSNYNDVRNDREALKTQYRTLENVVSQTNAKLDSLQSLAAEVASAKRKNYNQSPEYVNRLLSACHSKMRSSYSSKVESSCSKPANWLDERTGDAGVKHEGSGSAEGFA